MPFLSHRYKGSLAQWKPVFIKESSHSQESFKGFSYPCKCTTDLAIKNSEDTSDTNPVLKPIYLGSGCACCKCRTTATPGEGNGAALAFTQEIKTLLKSTSALLPRPSMIPAKRQLWKAEDHHPHTL